MPSTYSLMKFFSHAQIFTYITILSIFLFTSLKIDEEPITSCNSLNPFQRVILILLPIFALITLFVLIYPFANNHQLFPGSDDEDCINGAVALFIHGGDPYTFRSYLGHSLNYLPGTILTSAPFTLLGNSAYQNFFWIAVYGMFLMSLRSNYKNTIIIFYALCLSPGVIHQVVVGLEHISNSIYVMLSSYTFYYVLTRNKFWVYKLLAAIILGLTMCGRINYLLILPAIVYYTVHIDKKYVFKNSFWMIPGIATFILLLSLYPHSINIPLNGVMHRVERFDSRLPFFSIISIFGGHLVALLLNFIFRLKNKDHEFLLSCGIIAIMPFVMTVYIELSQHISMPFSHASYLYSGIVFFIPLLLSKQCKT